MEDRIRKLEATVEQIEARNRRVEAEKAWETSAVRIGAITVSVYAVTAVVFYFLQIEQFLLNALIPAIGYFLSMRSLPFIKQWWIRRRMEQ